MDIDDLASVPDLILLPDVPLLAALHKLRMAGIDQAPVVDEQNRLVGELRARRAADSIQHSYAHDGPVLVGSAMSWDFQTLCANSSLSAAQERMRQRDIDSIYVVSGDLRLVGVLSRIRLDEAIASCGGCSADPSRHEICRGRWCRHARICAKSDSSGDAARGA